MLVKLAKYAVGATAVAFVLSSCSNNATTVNGNRDDTRYLTEISHPATRWEDVTRNKCVTKYRTSTTTFNGKITTRRTPYSECRSVVIGHHQIAYRQVTRPAKWCVELDNVNGDTDADDRWYTVTSSVYYSVNPKRDGSKVIKMAYLNVGC